MLWPSRRSLPGEHASSHPANCGKPPSDIERRCLGIILPPRLGSFFEKVEDSNKCRSNVISAMLQNVWIVLSFGKRWLSGNHPHFMATKSNKTPTASLEWIICFSSGTVLGRKKPEIESSVKKENLCFFADYQHPRSCRCRSLCGNFLYIKESFDCIPSSPTWVPCREEASVASRIRLPVRSFLLQTNRFSPEGGKTSHSMLLVPRDTFLLPLGGGGGVFSVLSVALR